jgi:2-oxoglutarate dehydrogenase E2 component (dihydrolipoamide succinyltransferase)
MTIELKIPDVGESIREVQIGRWLKKEGDAIDQDENVVELETDKASMELPAPEAGVLAKILKQQGETVAVGEVIAYLEKDGKAPREKRDSEASAEKKPAPKEPSEKKSATEKTATKESEPVAAEQKREEPTEPGGKNNSDDGNSAVELPVTPSARRALRDHGLAAADIQAKGPRIHRKDVLRYVEQHQKEEKRKPLASPQPPATSPPPSTSSIQHQASSIQQPASSISPASGELEEIVPMSLIRRRIAERLVEAQQQAALLTTFNEIDMSAVQQIRAAYRERFLEKYGIKLGITSFFVKAAVDALKQQPELNAEIRGTDIVYRNYYHIGVAIGSTKGLVVPVLQFAERLSFAEIERAIDDFAQRAAKNKLKPQELEGGTFTITNGGIFGSLLSTPIVNPPQSGVLGLHAIQDRPVAREGQVVIRPMMYVALTYDHRLIDGREAVTFLRRIKEAVEDPSRMLLEV